MKKIVFLNILLFGMSAFAGGSEVGNPWPWDPEADYKNSVKELQILLKNRDILSILGAHGKITSITATGANYIIQNSQCSLTAEVTYEQSLFLDGKAHVIKSDCP